MIETLQRPAAGDDAFDRAFADLSALSRPGVEARMKSLALLRADLGVARAFWLASESGVVLGRVAANLSGADPAPGYVGQFECVSDRADVAAHLLRIAADWLRERGARLLLGPIDGSTWFDYRLAARQYADARPWEPVNPSTYPQFFAAAGWQPCADYRSVGFADLSALVRLTEPYAQRALQAGFRVRHFADLERDSAIVHALTLQAFAGQPNFEPIPLELFRSLYVPTIRNLDLRCGFIVETAEGAAAGFLLSFPDGDALVIKSTGVAPRFQGAGIGQALAHWAMAQGAAAGRTRMIGALIRADSPSDRRMVRFYEQAALLDWQHDYRLYACPDVA